MSEEISREEIAAMLARESMSEKMTKEDIDKMLSPIKAVVDAADDLLKLVRESEEITALSVMDKHISGVKMEGQE